jgi:iron complex outermembrane receptor protein
LGRDDPRFKGNRTGGIAGGTGNTIQINAVGGRPNAFYVYKQIYDKNNKPIEGLYEDLNRDGIINDNDLYTYKSPDPNMFMGMSSNLTVGKISGGFVARAYFENYVYNNVASNLGVRRAIFNPLGWLNNGSIDYLNTNFSNNQFFSDYYVQNASFLRVDNINVGYNAGRVIRGANLRVNFNVQNAFVWTKYKGIDPEINGGIDNTFYPRPRTYTLGLNLDF